MENTLSEFQDRPKKDEPSMQFNTFISKNCSPLLNYNQNPKDFDSIAYNKPQQIDLSSNCTEQNFINIQNCDVEGEQKITKIEAYQLSRLKVVLSVFLSLASGCIFALFLRNSIRIRIRSIYNKSSVYSATHFLITNCDGKQEIVPRLISTDEDKQKVQFVNRHMKYQYFENKQNKAFYPVYYHQIEKQALRDIKVLHSQGLTSEKVETHLKKYGNSEIQVPIPTVFEYLAETLTNVFFIFQYFTMLSWTLQGYLQFALLMIVSSLAIVLVNYYLLRLTLIKLKKFAKIELQVRVIRNGRDQTIDCVDLLPGDVFYYQNDMALPCDSLLLTGDILVNESSLTGESTPVPKINIEEDDQQDEIFNIETMKNHILYEGTKIIQIKGESVSGIVLRTGYTSYRGCIFRAMLYPKEIKFNFYRNGIYFILTLMVMGLIVYFAELYEVIEVGVPFDLCLYKLFDAATSMIPPALPNIFSICQTVSLLRLGRKKILATDPAKTVVAGDISIMCFDKTGTLTQDSMEIYGYADHKCQQVKKSIIQESDKEKLLHRFFGCCHGVYLIDGRNIGDELDVKMLEFSQYEIVKENPSAQNYKFRVKNKNSFLTVHRIWEFESSLQRMSIIVSDEESHKIYGVVKGSPERILEFCKKSSVDEKMFNELLNQLTNKGLRVIAFGYKELQSIEAVRETVEDNIEFLGLFILENKLKVDTADVIQRLKAGNILCKVISGDNLLTTIQCAKEALIVPYDESKIVVCNSMNDCYVQSNHEKKDIVQLLSSDKQSDYNLGVTGKFLEELQYNLKDKFNFHEKTIIRNLLINTHVYSRCKPKQKAEIVYLYQTHLNQQVGMIGDGANDCSAIKQANIGISFAKADASYSAPFSSSETSLECVIKVLCEGRCTLSNMIDCYKFYLTTNVSKFVVASTLILELSDISNSQLSFISYFMNIPFLIMIAFSKPLENLTPYRSISNMLDIMNFFSIYGQIILTTSQLLTQYLYLKSQGWYLKIAHVTITDSYVSKSQAVTVLFLGVASIYIFSLLAYFISYPTKEKLYRNKVLSILLLLISIFIFILYLHPSQSLKDFFDLDESVYSHGYFIHTQLIITLSFGVGMYLYEEQIVKRFLGPHRKCMNTHINPQISHQQ